jgi:hypothetical protein
VREVLSNEHPYRDSVPLIKPSSNLQKGDIYPVARPVAGSGRLMFAGQRREPWGRIRF